MINKNCTWHEQCELHNIKVGELWAISCPAEARKKKNPNFKDCLRYEQHERDDHAISEMTKQE